MTENSKHKPSRVRRISFPVIGVLLSVLALEAVLQLATFVSPQAAAVLDRHAGLLLPDAELIHRPNPAYPEHDAWGFRNAAVPERAFAVVLGDSQTYGAMVPRSDAWPQQLAKATSEPVYNMAFGGYGVGEANLLLDQALELKPDWVLFGLYAGNDLYDAYELVYKWGSLTELRSKNAETADAIDEAAATDPIEAAFKETHSVRASIKQWFAEHSKLYGLARALRNVSRGSAWQEEETPWSTVLEQTAANPDWVLVENKMSPTVLTPQYRLLALDRDDPRIMEGERITFDLLSRIEKRCTEAGARFAVVALPTKELVYKDVAAAAQAELTTSLQQLWRDETVFWESCSEFCSKNNIVFVDTLNELRQSLHTSERPFRQDADGHLTRNGNDVVSRTVQVEIAQNTE